MKRNSKIAKGIMIIAALSVPAKIIGGAMGSNAAGGKFEYSAYQFCIDATVALIFFFNRISNLEIPKKV